VVGGGAWALLGPAGRKPPDRAASRPPGVADQPTAREQELLAQVETLKAANEELRSRTRDLEVQVEERDRAAAEAVAIAQPAADAPAEGMPSDEEVDKALRRYLAAMPALAMGETPQAVLDLRELLARGGSQLIGKLREQFSDDSGDLQMRIAAAHALAQSCDPEAIGFLKETLDDPNVGFFLHRFASHALAFSPAEGLEPTLTVVARTNADAGARANAAFGLARRGTDEGIAIYLEECDAAVERKDTLAIGYLSGFRLVPEKALPEVRKRLLTYKDPQMVLVMIEMLRSRSDTGAVPTLEKLAYDSTQPIEVQKAAQGAIKALTPTPPDAGKE